MEGSLPRRHCINGRDQETRKLIQLESLPNGRLIEDVEGLGVKSGKVCIKKRVGLNARW